MKKIRISLFGKPQKGFSFLNTGNAAEDLQKHDELKAKPKLVLGEVRWGRKLRGFEESEFRLDWVPDYVNVIQQRVDPATGKRYYRYVDAYSRINPKDEFNRLFPQELHETTPNEE